MGSARITQAQTEVITQTQGSARVTQVQTEVITQSTGEIRVSLLTLAVLSGISGTAIEDPSTGQYYPIICCTF